VKLVKYNDPILHEAPQRFNFSDPPMDPLQLSEDLKEAMIKFKGVGLSANQVGLPYQVFAAGDYHDPDNIIVAFNPRIVFQSDQIIPIEEGCLSYPGLFLIVDRPSIIRMRAADHIGRVDTKVYDGIPARIILHEMDHMMGTNFTQKVSKIKLDRAKQHKKKLDKLREKNLKRIQQNERIG
tara:strand:- start:45 stop:587 length:543 start_codon:yes stop_codon:yes gene_type:complete